jgi:hypothetical protein
MVTTVLIPTLRKYRSGVDAVELFEALENNFARQAKFVILIAGASGFYMLDYIDAWGRYSEPRFWWLHAMTMVWALFMFVLFIAAYIACSKNTPRQSPRRHSYSCRSFIWSCSH